MTVTYGDEINANTDDFIASLNDFITNGDTLNEHLTVTFGPTKYKVFVNHFYASNFNNNNDFDVTIDPPDNTIQYINNDITVYNFPELLEYYYPNIQCSEIITTLPNYTRYINNLANTINLFRKDCGLAVEKIF